MQGIKYAMAPYMSGGLTACEQLRCLGLKELLRPESAVLRGGDLFSASRHMELEIIKGHRYITYQSEWVKAYLMPYCGNATLMPSKMMLRKAFLDADAWRFDPERELTVFCSTSLNAAPNKGLYTLLKALKFLRLKGVTVKCVLAGTPPQRGIRRSGYTRFLQREIERSGIGDFIVLAGSMGERELVRAIQVASVVVVPSFVESYSMTLAEAMAVGVPVVTTYAGAMPELAKDGESALFFPAGDCGACAMQLDRVLSSPELAVRLGAAARVSSLARHAPESVLRRQIENYQTVWDALSVSGSGTKEKA
jgi:glycosyltransferase involved in cell wall biosynthesis